MILKNVEGNGYNRSNPSHIHLVRIGSGSGGLQEYGSQDNEVSLISKNAYMK